MMPATKEMKIDDLLSIEDDPSILEFRCADTDLLLWPHIRISLFRMIITDRLFLPTLSSGAYTSVRATTKLATMARSASWNLTRRTQFQPQVCVVSNGIANQLADGKWFNRLVDHFAAASSVETLTLEDHFEWKWTFPRYNENVRFLAPLRAQQALIGRLGLRKKHYQQARGLIEIVRDRARRQLGWEMSGVRMNELVTDLARKIASMPEQYRACLKMLSRIRPRLLMIGSASYGGLYSTLIAAARQLGIPTAEYQHGAVSAGHDGYNFAPIVAGSDHFRRVVPDFFLCYGGWWTGQMNLPSQAVRIGNPHRDSRLASADNTDRRNRVLILSDGMEFNSYLELARSVVRPAKKRGLEVFIRPHQLERTRVKLQFGNDFGDVRIDENPDVFTSLVQSEVVVSEISTGLFEAIGLANQICMWDTAKARFTYPNHPFQCFRTGEDLADLIENSRGASVKEDAAAFWEPNWQVNYRNFLATLGIGNDPK